MARTEASLSGVIRPQIVTSSTVAKDTVVVRLWGEQDRSTVPAVAANLASVVALEEANVVVDLSEVRFINAATIRVLTAAGDFMVGQSRTFALRSPSSCVQRIIDICGGCAFYEPEGM